MLKYLQFKPASGDNYVGLDTRDHSYSLCIGKSYEEAIVVGLEEVAEQEKDSYYQCIRN